MTQGYSFSKPNHQIFTSTEVPEYYVAVDTSIKVGDVLNLQILPIAPVLVKFPLNVYSMDVTLEENNTWTVAPSKDYSGVLVSD